MHQVSRWYLHWMHLDLAYSLSDSGASRHTMYEDQVLTPMMSIPLAKDRIQLPSVLAEGVLMEVCVFPGKKGFWLEDRVLVNMIERKPDSNYEFTTIVLSKIVW